MHNYVSDTYTCLRAKVPKKVLKGICRKASQLEKIKKRKPVSVSLRTTGVWMPALATDIYHALSSNMKFVASWSTMPA